VPVELQADCWRWLSLNLDMSTGSQEIHQSDDETVNFPNLVYYIFRAHKYSSEYSCPIQFENRNAKLARPSSVLTVVRVL
jgi:hypothetical protein